MGAPSPWFWLVTPTFHDLTPRFQFRFTSEATGSTRVEESIQAVALSWTLIIDGVEFDVAQAQTTLSRLADTESGQIGIFYQYTPAPDPLRTVVVQP